MKSIEQSYTIHAPLEKVWACFFDPDLIEKWGGGPAKIEEKEGSDFSLWGGDIHGTNKEIEKHKKIVQDWYGGEWNKPSQVTFTFHSNKNTTTVELHHTDLPKGEIESFADGWKDYYLGAIKEYLEQ